MLWFVEQRWLVSRSSNSLFKEPGWARLVGFFERVYDGVTGWLGTNEVSPQRTARIRSRLQPSFRQKCRCNPSLSMEAAGGSLRSSPATRPIEEHESSLPKCERCEIPMHCIAAQSSRTSAIYREQKPLQQRSITLIRCHNFAAHFDSLLESSPSRTPNRLESA